MSDIITYDRIQMRQGTYAALIANNEVLRAGEWCLETDTNKVKMGNGTTAYTSLAYQANNFIGTATGTNTLTVSYASKPILYNGLVVFLVASGANTTAVTFNPNALGALDVRKHGNLALAAGDIAGAGHVLMLAYVAGSPNRWELLNPATGVSLADALVFKGVIDCSANPNYPAADAGDAYRVNVAGKIGGASGAVVEAGDMLLCFVDATASGTQAGVGANWNITQNNLDGAVIGPASAVVDDFAMFNGTTGKIIKDSGYSRDTDVALAANSDSKFATQKAVKAYVDTAVASAPGTYTDENAQDALAAAFAAGTHVNVTVTYNDAANLFSFAVPSFGYGTISALGAIGSSPNANAATLAGSTLNLEPASASYGGVVTTGTQTLAGAKTFSGTVTLTLAPVFTDGPGSRAALGLGTAATQSTGTSGATVPLLNGTNTWANVQTFTLSPTEPDPSGATDAVNLRTLQSYLATLEGKPQCAYASTSALPSCTYSNGASGVGATLTATTNGPLVIDSVTTVLGAAGLGYLIGGQVAGLQNGWYTMSQQGIVAVQPWILTRRTESDQAAEISAGYITAIEAPSGLTGGTGNNGKVFISIAPSPFVVGTDSLTFTSPGSTSAWGAITGTLSAQTDLQAALDAKQIGIQFKSEGSNLGASATVNTVNVTGSGVTAVRASNTVTINIPAAVGGGGVSSDLGLVSQIPTIPLFL